MDSGEASGSTAMAAQNGNGAPHGIAGRPAGAGDAAALVLLLAALGHSAAAGAVAARLQALLRSPRHAVLAAGEAAGSGPWSACSPCVGAEERSGALPAGKGARGRGIGARLVRKAAALARAARCAGLVMATGTGRRAAQGVEGRSLRCVRGLDGMEAG